jgi:asparagine synthase (glutamine-hydrolysing)
MCGWAVLWRQALDPSPELAAQVRGMADMLRHRGPDDSDVWVDDQAGLAFGFRRLAIVDLSPAGRQPMQSESRRYAIVFNGEVYNFNQLRHELEQLGHSFRGHSDTEVMLAAIEQWGHEEAVGRFVGMFSFALWDAKERRLSLVRDRLGIKPLYYGWAGSTFLAGSELKALRAHPDFRPEVDRDALTLFLLHGSVPTPHCIYRGIHQLPPGCILTIDPSCSDSPPPVPYWSALGVAEKGVAHPFLGTAREAVQRLEELLREAVKVRMIADVPLGAFLSGGVDSSTVVALMQAQSTQRVKTFSIGFHEDDYNEAVYARAVAQHLGTEHTELYVTTAEAQAVIPSLSEVYDEPFSDSSQIPTFLVAQLARSCVTVSLSGDGGDELFGGYTRYFRANAFWRKVRFLPSCVGRGVARLLDSVGTAACSQRFDWLSNLSPRLGGRTSIGAKIHTLAGMVGAPSMEALYRRTLSHWKDRSPPAIGGWVPPTVLTDPDRWPKFHNFMLRMMYFDTVGYLPDDILTKLDRASMAVSLEARVPLLDHRVVEFAWQVPLRMKIQNREGKWLLRQVLYKYVPRDLIDRPKKGFGVPIHLWLRGPLRPWAEELLAERRLREEGFFDPAPIRACWAEHLAGRESWGQRLWDVLMFQAWLERWGKGLKPAP